MVCGRFNGCEAGIQGRATHFFTVPLLAAPTQTLSVNDAGPCSAAAFVFLHGNMKIWSMNR